MNIKTLLKKIYDYPYIPKERRLYYEKVSRIFEWDAVKSFVKPNSRFLDVGCGDAFVITNAKNELKCETVGVEPYLNSFDSFDGNKYYKNGLTIYNAFAENLPFNDKEFDVVYCSHVLEHVDDRAKSLLEMKRVLKDDGILIIGFPTFFMTVISFFTQIFLTTHVTLINYFFYEKFKIPKPRFIEIFIPRSHSYPEKTILNDLYNYRSSCWKKLATKEFKIIKTIRPCIYPYHNYRQFFKIRKTKRVSSSIYYICKKSK